MVDKQRILIVDDDTEIREGLRILLSGENYTILEAADGKQALEQMSDTIDLVILDIMMPKLDGIEMLRRLREEGNRAHVVFLTAYSDFSYAQSALKLGAADYLLKPFSRQDIEEMLGKIKQKLDKEEKEEQLQDLLTDKFEGNLAQKPR